MAEGEVQRRLAAIVSADVAGYSRLMGEDEAGTLATMTVPTAMDLTVVQHPKRGCSRRARPRRH